jgi:hypothetical protein
MIAYRYRTGSRDQSESRALVTASTGTVSRIAAGKWCIRMGSYRVQETEGPTD